MVLAAAVRRGAAALAVRVVWRLVVARAGAVRVAVRRRAVAVPVRRVRVVARAAVVRRVVARRAGLRVVRAAVVERVTEVVSFFSRSVSRFSSAFSWAVIARFTEAALGAVRVVRRGAVLRAVVRRAVVRAAVRLVAGLRVVLVAERVVVRLVPVLLVVRGIGPGPPSRLSALLAGAP